MADREVSARNALGRQVAIVTGGASGIGRAVCLALAEEGANIIAVDIDQAGVCGTIEELEKTETSPASMCLALDVSNECDMEEMVRQTLARFDRIDILVPCAGILRPKGSLPKPLSDLTIQEWDAVINTNLRGTFLTNRAVLPTMIAQRKGQIVNISSTSGKQGRAYDSAYCASKFGIIGLTESLAEEVRQHNIKVNVILPDAVDTPLWEQNGPIPRPADALSTAQVASFILYLLTMPQDTTLLNPIISSFRTRRRVTATQTLRHGE
jgi:NAD(P)-dependent dehydrogenase (short-subunit alcohol dehydrogenase family)